jgi:hypothetical protein
MIKYVALFAAITVVSISAMAQEPSILGTWILIKAEKMLPDGSRVPDYGPNPHGQAIFTEDCNGPQNLDTKMAFS